MDVLTTILLSLTTGLLAFIAKKLTDTLDKFEKQIEIHDKRHDASDVVMSHLLKEPFSSRNVATGRNGWPHIFEKNT